jgi:hypothetical protein
LSNKNKCGGKSCPHIERRYYDGVKACAIKRNGKAGICPCGSCLVRVVCIKICDEKFRAWEQATNNGRVYIDNNKRFRRPIGDLHRNGGKGQRFRM